MDVAGRYDTERYDTMLVRIAAGDRAAFRHLYEQTSSRLYGICYGILRDRTRAEDALQDAYVRIWERARNFDTAKGSGMTWLATLTRRVALNEARRKPPITLSIDRAETGISELADPGAEPNPIGDRRLMSCLDQLREDYRQAVVMAYVHGYSHGELAQRLDRPIGTIKSWINRSLIELKRCMG
jgi:RNA polymerase sigma-70 factor (ECF subfamily)